MNYDINRPWLTLDDWQKEYIFDKFCERNNLLLTGRQSGKTAAMSMRAVELCVNYFKKGEFVLINSITEKQAYHVLAKARVYAEEKYYNQIIFKKDKRPTMHRINFKNGTGILCYAAGETGEGLRGLTIKKLMIDEGARMSEEYYIAVQPMISIINGSMDISSTPAGKRHRDGTEKFFYKCSKDKIFKKYYISAEDCPRHSKKFLRTQKERLSRLAYAQEYLAIFTDELKRIFDDELLKETCVEEKQEIIKGKNYFIGVDVAGFGKDACTYEVFEVLRSNTIIQRENIVEKRNYTTDTSRKIIELNKAYNFEKIGIDDGGVGFGVYSELMNEDETKRKTVALNNASRETNPDGTKSKKLLKEEMYLNLLTLMENRKVRLLKDKEITASLASIQYDENGKIFGFDSHIAEGINRGIWLATKAKNLNIIIRSF